MKEYKAYIAMVPGDANAEYTMARLYAMQGKQAEAYKWMDKAIKNGFNYSFVLTTDPVMAGLRKTDKWRTILKTMNKKEWKKESL